MKETYLHYSLAAKCIKKRREENLTLQMKLNSHNSNTHLAHLDLTVCLVQNPAHYHAYEVWPKASPWLIVDLVKHGQWVIHTATSKTLLAIVEQFVLNFNISCIIWPLDMCV
jgi:hypothetical protein